MWHFYHTEALFMIRFSLVMMLIGFLIGSIPWPCLVPPAAGLLDAAFNDAASTFLGVSVGITALWIACMIKYAVCRWLRSKTSERGVNAANQSFHIMNSTKASQP